MNDEVLAIPAMAATTITKSMAGDKNSSLRKCFPIDQHQFVGKFLRRPKEDGNVLFGVNSIHCLKCQIDGSLLVNS